MKILLGTHYLAKTGGTESYTYALATELKRLGHEVEHFANVRGGVSDLLEERGVPFMSADHYDLILANHTTVVEKLWTHGFIVQTCHGNIAELEQPSPYADIYVSVSEEVRDHLQNLGFQSAAVIPNGIDCHRFSPRKPVSKTLTKVLSLCQSDEANDFIRKCCEAINVEFLCSNKFTDNVWSIEDLINQSDLVIGLGRSAYDAMACGRAVLVYDYREYMGEFLGDGLLTPDTIGKSMYCNCSGRANRMKFDEQTFVEEMQKYSPELAAWSREFAQKNLNIEQAVQRYLDICRDADVRQVHSTFKTRMNRELEKERQTLREALSDKEQLQHQMVCDQLQMKDMNEAFSANRQKHLRAIRALLYLNVVLILSLLALVIYMFS